MPTYSFIDVNATLTSTLGTVNLAYGAAASEEGITIARNAEKTIQTIGAGGSNMFSLRADKSGTVTCRYLKTSNTNAALMALYDAQSLSSATWGINTIQVNNTATGESYTCRECAFSKVPDINFAEEGGIQEWEFLAGYVDGVGGKYH